VSPTQIRRGVTEKELMLGLLQPSMRRGIEKTSNRYRTIASVRMTRKF
jgi:hypothetical protein